MRPDLFTVVRLRAEVAHAAQCFRLTVIELKSLDAAPDVAFDALDELDGAHRLEILWYEAPSPPSTPGRPTERPPPPKPTKPTKPTNPTKPANPAKLGPPPHATPTGTLAFRLWSPLAAAEAVGHVDPDGLKGPPGGPLKPSRPSKPLLVGAVNVSDTAAYARGRA
ncbi:uncharacterized protein CcaverHIS019_0700030 [Cutaneotrichosporon cavernicola]|uniref:Uncharacterized protein n=1 Tax=Cutaneotrichosporon cavernicola TaxID=279322 RepID=A0AA48L936_9TREE|nr:uncharacterized protein CcaverHIS019_0700030 [Cutaneotrichosporon cavernicola]BEI94431.1 hypothetical protein CcaverHIS019_0700030 [Cutaneotrichosporon cavernicola]